MDSNKSGRFYLVKEGEGYRPVHHPPLEICCPFFNGQLRVQNVNLYTVLVEQTSFHSLKGVQVRGLGRTTADHPSPATPHSLGCPTLVLSSYQMAQFGAASSSVVGSEGGRLQYFGLIKL
ncbi:unnamed protein product [Pleuronectes platessa]|uniref:Uncharacterized protein n=1 Tax=Pleuronectes platessa TaxID=8262 RepID=A0A9N7TIT7_PLEPL|nr:unnamed protein product [Pleuronectes platessa]